MWLRQSLWSLFYSCVLRINQWKTEWNGNWAQVYVAVCCFDARGYIGNKRSLSIIEARFELRGLVLRKTGVWRGEGGYFEYANHNGRTIYPLIRKTGFVFYYIGKCIFLSWRVVLCLNQSFTYVGRLLPPRRIYSYIKKICDERKIKMEIVW